MRKIVPWLMAFVFVAVVGAVLYLFWSLDWRWRPHAVTKNQTEIAQALSQAGWVSPHLTGPALYVVAYRDCADCNAFETQEFAKLQAAGVDTRVIAVARADDNGQARSTAPERATVAELWTNRSWKLFQQWMAADPPGAWTAPGVPAADGDAARTAVVEAGRALAVNLPPLLKANGVRFGYPVLVWWSKDGKLWACACAKPQTWKYVEKDLGA